MKTFRIILLFILFLGSSENLFSQHSKDSLGLELLGSGGLGSLFYESRWSQQSLSLGLSFAPIDRNNGVGLVFPIMYHRFFFQGDHSLIAGAGQGVTITTRGNFFILGLLQLGWQWKKSDSPWTLRLSYTPLISYLFDFQWQHWAGLSLSFDLPRNK